MSESAVGQDEPDFFVSYTKTDRAWAEWIAWELERDRYGVLIQAWDMVPGENWVNSIQDGVARAKRTIALLSPDYLSSTYGKAEWQVAWRDDPVGDQRKLIVLRVAECERPGLLGSIVSADLFDLNEAQTRSELRRVINQAVTGRAKPTDQPPFPGPGRLRAIEVQPRFPGALPPIWNVPARNPNFTGRDSDLDRLRAALTSHPMPTLCTLHGMPGVGKTQTAIEYIHRHKNDYDLVWWINAEKAEEAIGIDDQFIELGSEIGLDVVKTPRVGVEVVIRLIHRALRDRNRWLLVFDNAESSRDIEDHLPPAGSGQVLITTRRDGFRVLGDVLDLDVLEREDSIMMLRRCAPSLTRSDAVAISERLGDLPLALAQAAAYLDKTQLPASEYLALLQTRAADLHSRGQADRHPNKIATIWSASLNELRASVPEAVQLLTLCSWLAPEPVPRDLFNKHATLLPAPLNATANDPIAFADAVGALADYSLARCTVNDILVHRLVQDVIRQDDGNITGPSPLDCVLTLLRADLPAEINDKPSNWPRWRQLLRHVLAATTHQNELDSTAVAETAWLLDRAGNYLYVHGRPADAVGLLERSVYLRERIPGTGNSEMATTLNYLGLGLADLGQRHSAIEVLKRALHLLETADQPDDLAIAEVLNHLGWAHVLLGRLAAALPIYKRALTIHETADRPDWGKVAANLNGLGRALADLGQPADALPLHERALQLVEADDLWVGTTLAYQGRALMDLGRPAEALALLERAFIIRETAYGSDHPWLATVLNHRGRALTDLGRPAEALALHERALAIHEAAYGRDHPDVVADLDHMARALSGMGRHDEAIALRRRMVKKDG
ncbi:MAG TPA: FxSxx-COOH system tetratricopeptide repeat protein [Pseudonocardiaceae bacterium]|nr:FxSxx-COOH system tetratricopeptide repeat protein [Pseudonocardiaceae bacterium]